MNRTYLALGLLAPSGLALSSCDRAAPAPSGSAASATTPATPGAGPGAAAIAAGTSPAGGASDAAPRDGASGAAASASSSARTVTFDDEAEGAPPSAFEPVVGDWSVARVGGATGLEVDGSRWRNGTPSTSLADQAKRLYGDRYAEFLDGVKAFAFFPLAIAKAPPPAGDLAIRVRFHPFGGKIDQAAGIAFGIGADGSYLAVRANALEDNILYFKVVRGKRTIVETVRDVPTPTRTWHTLAVELRGKELVVRLDGERRLEKTLDSPPSGRVGLWSKADSQVLFDDFAIGPP